MTLADYIRANGPIKTARVSSAQAKGAAKKYPYWGAVRYEIRLSRSGIPINGATERASSDRRSQRLVERDCQQLCDAENRIEVQTIGALSDETQEYVLVQITSDAYTAEQEKRKADEQRTTEAKQNLAAYAAAYDGAKQ